jgi:hypothetical protein
MWDWFSAVRDFLTNNLLEYHTLDPLPANPQFWPGGSTPEPGGFCPQLKKDLSVLQEILRKVRESEGRN